jgi:putative ABC transport system permease protein
VRIFRHLLGGLVTLKYNFGLALRNIRRTPVLSGLMVAAIGIGIGASMSMVTVNYRFQANPIPQKSDVLHYVRLDSWSADEPFQGGNVPPNQVTYLDATALMRAKPAYRQAAMSRARMAVEPPDRDQRPYFADARATTADFFPMFDAPFRYGGGWTAEIDDAAEQVVVLSAETNDRLFGGENSVGRTVTLAGANYRVLGVLDEWQLSNRFWDIGVGGGPGSELEDFFIPWSLMVANELQRQGNTNCWKPVDGEGLSAFLNSECIWIQFWAELRTDAEREAFVGFLDAYAMDQKELGRFERPLDNRATPLMEWLDEADSVPTEAIVLLGLSVIFLAVCLLNTLGLLLAKFLGKASEIGIRRALGASRRTLFQQYLVEAGVIGIVGGLFGIALTSLGLKGIDGQFEQDLSALLSIDWTMALTAVALAIVATLITSIYPTWRACNVQPAMHLSAN